MSLDINFKPCESFVKIQTIETLMKFLLIYSNNFRDKTRVYIVFRDFIKPMMAVEITDEPSPDYLKALEGYQKTIETLLDEKCRAVEHDKEKLEACEKELVQELKQFFNN